MQVVVLFFVFSLLFGSIDPAPCHLFSQGCSCAQCLRYHRFLEGRKAERAGTDCQCDLCTKYPDNTEVHHRPREDSRGFQYTSK